MNSRDRRVLKVALNYKRRQSRQRWIEYLTSQWAMMYNLSILFRLSLNPLSRWMTLFRCWLRYRREGEYDPWISISMIRTRYVARRLDTTTCSFHGHATNINVPFIWLPNPIANHFAELGACNVAYKGASPGVLRAAGMDTAIHIPCGEQYWDCAETPITNIRHQVKNTVPAHKKPKRGKGNFMVSWRSTPSLQARVESTSCDE
jgi:hypothetical protein